MIYRKPFFIVAAMTDIDVATPTTEAASMSDLIELRVDLFEDISEQHIREVFKGAQVLFNKPIIGTIRDPSEGGGRLIQDRLTIYRTISEYSSYIDIELAFPSIIKSFRESCTHGSVRIIGSYHNFQETPEEAALEDIVEGALKLPVDIIKIAVMARQREDLIRLLLFNHRHRDKEIASMAMGMEGLPSRVISGLFGSVMTYGYVGRSTAPGQLSVFELRNIIKRLNLIQ